MAIQSYMADLALHIGQINDLYDVITACKLMQHKHHIATYTVVSVPSTSFEYLLLLPPLNLSLQGMNFIIIRNFTDAEV